MLKIRYIFLILSCGLVLNKTLLSQELQYTELNRNIDAFFDVCDKEIYTRQSIYQPKESQELSNEWNYFLQSYNWSLPSSPALSTLADVTLYSSAQELFPFSISLNYLYNTPENQFFPLEKVRENLRNKINQNDNLDAIENANKLQNMFDVMFGEFENRRESLQQTRRIGENYLNIFKNAFFNRGRKAYLINKSNEVFTDKCGNLFIGMSDNLQIDKEPIFQHEAGHILINTNATLKEANAFLSDPDALNNYFSIVSKGTAVVNNGRSENINPKVSEKNIFDALTSISTTIAKSNDEVLIDAISLLKENNPNNYIEMLNAYLSSDSVRINIAKTIKTIKDKSAKYTNLPLVPYFSRANNDFLKMLILNPPGNDQVRQLIATGDENKIQLTSKYIIGLFSGKNNLRELLSEYGQNMPEEELQFADFLSDVFYSSSEINWQLVENQYEEITRFKEDISPEINALNIFISKYQQQPYEGI